MESVKEDLVKLDINDLLGCLSEQNKGLQTQFKKFVDRRHVLLNTLHTGLSHFVATRYLRFRQKWRKLRIDVTVLHGILVIHNSPKKIHATTPFNFGSCMQRVLRKGSEIMAEACFGNIF